MINQTSTLKELAKLKEDCVKAMTAFFDFVEENDIDFSFARHTLRVAEDAAFLKQRKAIAKKRKGKSK